MYSYLNKIVSSTLRFKMLSCIRIIFTSFILMLITSTLFAQPNITRTEYYIDNDPGYGNGIAISTGVGNNVNGSFSIDLSTVSEGVHIVGVRSKDVNGAWSLDNKWIFIKPISSGAAAPVPNITRVEYFLDNDPGYGNGIELPLTPNTTINNLVINISLLPLAEGVHLVGIRAKDANGAWSIDNRWIFLKPFTTGVSLPVPNITRLEYFIDTDPGYGNATALSITPTQQINAVPINLNLTTLSEGVHIVGVRAKDANNAWSIDNRWLFLKPYFNGQVAPSRNITAMEYYFNTDPGYGNGVQIAVDPMVQVVGKPIYANITNLPAGKHYYFVRTRDNTGAWSLDYRDSFTLAAPTAAPFVNLNSISLSNLCKQATFTVGYHATGTYLAGNQFIVELSDGTGSFVFPAIVGSINSTSNGIIQCNIPVISSTGNAFKMRVRSTNPAITGPELPAPVTIYKYFIGNDTTVNALCDVANVSLVFNLQGGTTVWNTPNPAQAALGTYQVIATNQLGCTDTANATVSQDVITWTGSTSSNWFTATNWMPAKVPGDSSHIIIGAGTPFNCTIGASNAKASSIQLKNGAGITINPGFTLSIKGNCNALPAPGMPPGNEPISNKQATLQPKNLKR